MKRFLAAVFALTLFIAVSGPAWADEKKESGKKDEAAEGSSRKKGKGDKEKSKSFTGKIKAMDAKNRTVTLTKKSKGVESEAVIVIKDSTTFKNVKAFADLKVGDRIGVKYMEEGGKKVAKSVEFKINKGKGKGHGHHKKKKDKEKEDDDE
ncbi:MAG: hypothetical protein A3G34_00990 [Candidatus Lindowbacteria bacterium RIFCSPLOWO2_12_FULL_62_27]|nr:MAG: hypothetical protein A3G34_00990 [Candidatus Lindowbacteria bacterium RIFCSPLOWO2_12_FULL_62_27]OGH58280.1 MAG: hypothetical protein A3I06_09130 [Candidatus Lindowbacteria bacterium RIFCSPLOWO2_02_FULL_62_12]